MGLEEGRGRYTGEDGHYGFVNCLNLSGLEDVTCEEGGYEEHDEDEEGP